MPEWMLLEQVDGDTFVGLDQMCEADTFGRAVEQLLTADLCDSPVIRCALHLDIVLGSGSPTRMNIRTSHGVFRVVPVADSNDLAHLARMATLVEAQAREVLARLADGGVVGP